MARFPRGTTARTAKPARPTRKLRAAALVRAVPPAPPADAVELSTALHCVGEFGQCLRNADTKAAALASVHGLLLTVLVGGFPGSQDLFGLSWPRLALLLSCVFLSVVAGVCLLGTQLPRLTPPTGPEPSPLAIPTAALASNRSYRPADPTLLTEQAWQQAYALAGIALVKFRWLRRATAITGLALVGFLAWIGLSLVIAPRP